MFTSRTRASLAACATLAALGLAAAPAAHAQSLTLKSGDVVTVSGAGTTNANPIGTAVTATKTSYDDSTSGSFYAVETTGTAAFTLGTGGSISSTKNGSVGLSAEGSGPITITGGSITAGKFGDGLDAGGSGPVTISGGTFTGGTYSGGLFAEGSGTVTITGGTFTGGSGGFGLDVNNNSSIDLYGMFDNFMPGNTTLPSDSNAGASGTFMGTLTNNTVAQTFTYRNFGTITLHNTAPAAAPEPSQYAAFAVGLLGLGALALKARKRHAA